MKYNHYKLIVKSASKKAPKVIEVPQGILGILVLFLRAMRHSYQHGGIFNYKGETIAYFNNKTGTVEGAITK